jgi:hypothetical protein
LGKTLGTLPLEGEAEFQWGEEEKQAFPSKFVRCERKHPRAQNRRVAWIDGYLSSLSSHTPALRVKLASDILQRLGIRECLAKRVNITGHIFLGVYE